MATATETEARHAPWMVLRVPSDAEFGDDEFIAETALAHAAFVIWLAADHCRGAGYTERQLEALLFHELCHTTVAEADEETGRGGGPALVPHDVETFRAEVEHYGLWDADLRDVAPAFRQAGLFDAGEKEDEE